jgi:hypothetical protein
MDIFLMGSSVLPHFYNSPGAVSVLFGLQFLVL